MSLPTIQTEGRLLILDTKYANQLNGSLKSSVSFGINTINIHPSTCMLVSLRSFKASNSIFNVNANNNTFVYLIGSNTTTLTLPVRNYSVKTMAAYLDANTPFTVSYDTSDLSMTFSHSDPFIISGTGTVNTVLGFDDNNYSSINNALSSPFAIDFSGTRSLSFVIHSVGDNNINRNPIEFTKVAAEIPVNDRNIISYKGVGYSGIYSGESITDVFIDILDNNNNHVDFNNKDWSCEISLNFVERLAGNDDLPYNLNHYRNLLIQNILAKSEATL